MGGETNKKQKGNQGNLQPDLLKYNKLNVIAVLKNFKALIC